MSNRRREDRRPEPLPDAPAPYCDTFRYTVDGHGVVTIWGGMNGTWQAGMALPVQLAIELHQKLGATLADVIRKNAAPQPDQAELDKPTA
jgi:hypothetical protein